MRSNSASRIRHAASNTEDGLPVVQGWKLNFDSTCHWAGAFNKCNKKVKICTHPSSFGTRLGERVSANFQPCLKSRNNSQYNTQNKTFIWQPPLLSSHSHVLAALSSLLLLFSQIYVLHKFM